MSERNPFEQQPKGPEGAHRAGRELRCEEWEALLADALDGVMPPADGAAFEAHSHDCATCSGLLAQSRQGREWMSFLQIEPEMPGDLMERILSRTSGAVADRPLAVYGAPIAAGPNVLAIPRRKFVWDTRLMMTAAMAFFSIALTLNLAGVRLTGLRLADLTPANLETNLTRQFYGAKSQVVRYYDNLRFVYEVESKMRELRRDEETQRPATTQPKQETPAPQNTPPASSSPGNGHKNGGKLESAPSVSQPDVIFGKKVLASEKWSGKTRFGKTVASCPGASEVRNKEKEEVDTLVAFLRDQAERSLA
ncbi:MAG: zf-HC2 domain-containing protein [Silvibacterium sp.]